MNFPISYDNWRRLLTEEEQSFVQAMIVMKSPAAAADMCGIPTAKAKRLAKQARISTAVDLAKRQLRQDTQFTAADVAEDLMLIRDMALGRIPVAKVVTSKDDPPYTTYVRETSLQTANKAVENLGRMLGIFTDKKEISVPASDAQILKKIEDILGVTIDGEAEVIEDAELVNLIDAASEARDIENIKSKSIDAVVEDLLNDPVLKNALEERLLPRSPGEPV